MFLVHPFINYRLFNMSFFHHEEPPNPSKRCKFLRSTLKNCHTFCRKGSSPSLENYGNSSSDNYDDDEQEVFVSAVRSKYMESKSRRKASYPLDSSSWTFSSTTEQLFFSSKYMQQEGENNREGEDFYSAHSRLSRCSSATSAEAFLTAKATLSRFSSSSSLNFLDSLRRSIFQDFCHCEGWPFGLCRKALLLPPLPKSPSESWLSHKSTRLIKIP